MGVISLTYSMETDRLAGIKANSVHVDSNFNTLLNATNNKLEKDGSIVPTADLPMGNHKLTGVASPTLSGDAATKGYVDSNACMLAGAQTITGNKSFSGTAIFSNTTSFSGSMNIGNDVNIIRGIPQFMAAKSLTIDKTVTPGSIQRAHFVFKDKNDVLLGNIGAAKYTNGRYGMALVCGNNIGEISLTVEEDGTNLQLYVPSLCILASSPATSNTSRQVSTTEFVKNYAMGIPDWANQQAITPGIFGITTFTATKNGYVYCNQTSGDQSLVLRINSNPVGGCTSSHTGTSRSGLCAVCAGDVVESNQGALYFVPCKNL